MTPMQAITAATATAAEALGKARPARLPRCWLRS